MATININKEQLFKLIGKKLKDEELEGKISMFGIGVEEIKSHEIVLDVLPNRPDLLSVYGLARALSSFIGTSKENKEYFVNKSNYIINIDKAANDWPYAVAAVVKDIKFDDNKIKEIVQLQEKLCATFLRNRKKGGLGIYPLEKIKFPVKYTSDVPDKIKFIPLEYPYPINGKEILDKHPTGREYKNIVQGWKKFPIFVDANGAIMSMPPIINSNDLGKVTDETKNVFVEATGTDFNTISTALNILVTSLADMGGKIYSTKVVYKNKTHNLPNLKPSEIKVDVDYINNRLGLELKAINIKNLLLKMNYGSTKKDYVLLVPTYRADILHQIDLVEDVAIAYGYNNLKEDIPNVATTAEENNFEIFKRKICNILAGLGLLEVHTYNLTSKVNQSEKMNVDIKTVELANALNKDYDVLRAWLIPTMLQILKENKHHEYPQNIFGCGNVFKHDSQKDSCVAESVRLSVTLSHTNANFTEIKQVLDALVGALDLDYEIREVEHGSFIPGRVGRIKVKDTDVAYIGEIHPQVLENFELEMPVSVLEINLSDLFKIIRKEN